MTTAAAVEEKPFLQRELHSAVPPALSVQLFGGLSVTRDGYQLPKMRSRKEQWLLALLVLHGAGKPVDRLHVAGMLWPDSRESDALFYLRRSLTVLRDALGPEAARISSPTPRTLGIDLNGTDCDLFAFDDMVQRADPDSLRKVVALYVGPLLQGCTEEWVLPERDAREKNVLSALETLAGLTRESGDLTASVGYLRRLLELSPFQETALRALMQDLAAQGSHAAAGEAYRLFCVKLRRELNAEPAPKTELLHRRIQAEGGRRAELLPERVETATVTPEINVGTAHLPVPFSRLIGREAERQSVIAELHSARLVTLTGTGGVGKTRLSLAVAEEVRSDFADGAWFVDLSPLSDSSQLTSVILTALEGPAPTGDTHTHVLEEFLRSKCLLLILDNCEHLLSHVARLSQALLRKCPNLRILATSREPLRAPSERVWPVPSLIPDEAAQLFVERAGQARYGFQSTVANTDSVARICARLDGIPLAIEMAAARTRGMSALQIAADLDTAFRLLGQQGGHLDSRHQTLRSALDWSHGLLNDAERTLLARLSIFAGGWSLKGAEAVCADETLAADTIQDLLLALVDKSLVAHSDNRADEGRYRLLETTRAYASERLSEAQRVKLSLSLARYLLQLAETAKGFWSSPDEQKWLDCLEIELPNVRVALEPQSMIAAPDEPLYLRLATTLFHFWWRRPHVTEGRRFLKTTLSHYDASGQERMTEIRAAALNARGALANMQRDSPAALADHSEALTIRRKLGNRRGMAVSLHNMAMLHTARGEFPAAIASLEECVALYYALGDDGFARSNQQWLDETVAAINGDTQFAAEYARRKLETGSQRGQETSNLCSLVGEDAFRQGRVEEAHDYFGRGLSLRLQHRDLPAVAETLEFIAPVCGTLGPPTDLPLLYGATARLRESLGCPMMDCNRKTYEQTIREYRKAIGDAVFDAAWANGQAMTVEQAVAYALRK